MQTSELLAVSKNGVRIYFDPVNSHTATHFADTPQLRALVKEVLENMVIEGDRILFDKDMGQIVGSTDLLKNDEGDEIVYAKRKNRDVYTSFNKSKAPQPCSTVAVGLEKREDGSYELVSAWIGSIDSPPFPGDENETPESKPFWTTHSLAWGTQEIQLGTETTRCPW